MAIIQIANFGRNDEGVYTYRINGDKADLERVITESKDLGYEFWEKPIVEKTFRCYTVLLKLYIPKEMGYPAEEESK